MFVTMTRVAERAGLGRESLYKALSAEGNPKLATVLKVMQALDFRFVLSVAQPSRPSPPQMKGLWESAFMHPSHPFGVCAVASRQRDAAPPRRWAYS